MSEDIKKERNINGESDNKNNEDKVKALLQKNKAAALGLAVFLTVGTGLTGCGYNRDYNYDTPGPSSTGDAYRSGSSHGYSSNRWRSILGGSGGSGYSSGRSGSGGSVGG